MNLRVQLAASLGLLALTTPAALADGATYDFWGEKGLQVRYQVANKAPDAKWTHLSATAFHSPHYQKDVIEVTVLFPQSMPVSVFGVELSEAELAALRAAKPGILGLDFDGVAPPAVPSHDAWLTVDTRDGKRFQAGGRRGQLGSGTAGQVAAILDGIAARVFAERVGTPGEARSFTDVRYWATRADGRSLSLSFNGSGSASITFRAAPGLPEDLRLNETFTVEHPELDALQAAFQAAKPAGLPAQVSDLQVAIEGQPWQVTALANWYPYGAGTLTVQRRVGAGGMLEERAVETRQAPIAGGFFVLELAWGGGGRAQLFGQVGSLRADASGLGALLEKLEALAARRDVPRVFHGTVTVSEGKVTIRSASDELTLGDAGTNRVLARFPGRVVHVGGWFERTAPARLSVAEPRFFYAGIPDLWEDAALTRPHGMLQDRMTVQLTGAEGISALRVTGHDMMVRDSDGVGIEKRGWLRPEVVLEKASGAAGALEAR